MRQKQERVGKGVLEAKYKEAVRELLAEMNVPLLAETMPEPGQSAVLDRPIPTELSGLFCKLTVEVRPFGSYLADQGAHIRWHWEHDDGTTGSKSIGRVWFEQDDKSSARDARWRWKTTPTESGACTSKSVYLIERAI